VNNISFSSDNETWSTWVPFTTSKTFTLVGANIINGEKTIYYRVNDRVGNVGESIADTIILDTTAPEQLSIIINNGATYTNSADTILKLNAIDNVSGVSDMAFSSDGKIWSAWETFSTNKLFTLSPGDGEKTVHFRVRDIVGNINTTSDSIILDTMPPESLSISIEDSNFKTDPASIDLKLDAIDNGSGVKYMSFSYDGMIWTNWEDFAKTKHLTPTELEVENFIYYRVKDYANNIADSIYLTYKVNLSNGDGINGEDGNGDGDNNGSDPKDKKEDEPKSSFFGSIIIIIIIAILVIVIGFAIFMKKKKQKTEEDETAQEQPIMVKTDVSRFPGITPDSTDNAGVIPQEESKATTETALTPTQQSEQLSETTQTQQSQTTTTTLSTQQLQNSQVTVPQLPPAQGTVPVPPEHDTPTPNSESSIVTTVNQEQTQTEPQSQPSPPKGQVPGQEQELSSNTATGTASEDITTKMPDDNTINNDVDTSEEITETQTPPITTPTSGGTDPTTTADEPSTKTSVNGDTNSKNLDHE